MACIKNARGLPRPHEIVYNHTRSYSALNHPLDVYEYLENIRLISGFSIYGDRKWLRNIAVEIVLIWQPQFEADAYLRPRSSTGTANEACL